MFALKNHPLKRENRHGFSVVELLCVIAIIGTLVGLAMPAVQTVREAARNAICKNKLRQISLGTASYNSSFRRFPPGTLGSESPVHLSLGEYSSYINPSNDASPFFDDQHTSWLVLILPYLEQEALYQQLPRICTNSNQSYREAKLSDSSLPRWIDEIPAVQQVASSEIATYLCPSDGVEVVEGSSPIFSVIGSQPAYLFGIDTDRLLGMPSSDLQVSPAPTNYAGCTGAYSGGRLPEGIPAALESMRRYQGIFQSRTPTRTRDIRDGLSQTLLAGEVLGGILDRQKSAASSWFFDGLFRGSGGLGWESSTDLGLPGLEIVGDHWFSYPVGLASGHPTGVNVVMADGSVQSIARDVDWPLVYALCGMADGIVVPEFSP